jgi:hypothetical protein
MLYSSGVFFFCLHQVAEGVNNGLIETTVSLNILIEPWLWYSNGSKLARSQ